MQIITVTKNDNLRYTLSPTRQELVYQKLVKILPPEFASVFLKPKIKSNAIEWSLADGNIEIYESHTYSQLGEAEQNIISEKLNSLSFYIKQNLKAIPELKNKVERIIDIPGLDSAKLLKTNRGEMVVLSDWAHVRFDRAGGYNPFEKIVNKPRKVHPVTLNFIYSDNTLFKNQAIKIIYKGFPKNLNTREEAMIDLGKVPVSSILGVVYLDQNDDSQSLELTTSGDQEIYEIKIPYHTSLKINVKDQNGNLLDGYPIIIDSDGRKQEIVSDQGIVLVEDLLAGKSVQVRDGKNESNSLDYTLSRELNELDFIIDIPVPPPPPVLEYLSFFLYDYDNELIKDAQISISQKSNIIELDSESEGEYKALKRKFILDQKSKARVELNQNGKTKVLKHKFKIVKTKDEYHLKLKKNYWWLLLLLIPIILALLLSFQKSIVVQVLDEDGSRIQSANVEMSYDYNSLFDFNTKSFFSKTNYNDSRITNEKGVALFESLNYTVFDRVFSSYRKAHFVIRTNDTCYRDTMFKHNFYTYKDTIKFQLATPVNDINIMVLSSRDSLPIPNAEVEFISHMKDKEYQKFKGVTDERGIVNFIDIPFCGELKKVIGNKIDYFPDSIMNKSISEISDDINDRTLYLIDPVPCNNKTESGDVKGGEVLLSVPDENKTYTIKYDFYRLPDKLILYSGKSKNGKIIYDSGWVSNKNIKVIKPKSDCGGCDYIFAEILTQNDSTGWDLNFVCPQ